MALNLTQLNADIDDIIADLPVTVVTEYDTVTGTKSSLARNDFLADEGLRENVNFTIHLKISSLTTIPDVDETCMIAGVTYKILRKDTDDADQLLTLDLVELYSEQ